MEVYNGPHLVIKHEQQHGMLVNTWNTSPTNDLEYRSELMEHRLIVEKIKPSQVIWLLENLTFKVSDVTKVWVHENISDPIFRAGFINKRQDKFDQVAFVVGHDVLAYIEVMDIFKEDSTNGFKPKYFATEKEARNWLNEGTNNKEIKSENQTLEINYKGLDNEGRTIMEFKDSASEFTSTLKYFKSIIEQNQFMKNNVEKFSSLSPREKETLKFIIKGDTNGTISEKMSISPHTIRTHRNRIWKKLDIKQFTDCLKYKCFFN